MSFIKNKAKNSMNTIFVVFLSTSAFSAFVFNIIFQFKDLLIRTKTKINTKTINDSRK